MGYQEDPHAGEPYEDTAHIPFCFFEEEPDGPPETHLYTVQSCTPLPDNHSCEDRPAEEVDRILREQIAINCCEPVEKFLRGCYNLSSIDGVESCCYAAYYFSKCGEPAVGKTCDQ